MGEMNLKECLIFLDDILIFSETFEEYISRLEAVFSRLKEHGFKIKPSSANFSKVHLDNLAMWLVNKVSRQIMIRQRL